MKTHDRRSSLFWLLLSISIFIESIRLGIGTPGNPGMGFMSFGASGLLGILSVILFVRSSSRNKKAESPPLFSGFWRRSLAVLVSLALYSRLLPVTGFLISTFLLMTLLFWILERKKVWLVFVLSIFTTGITYYVFSVALNCQFPSGVFGF